MTNPTASLADVAGPAERRRRRFVANRAFGAIKAQYGADRTVMQTLADRLNDVASSPRFLAGHAMWFIVWILWNSGAFGLEPFDPFPFGLLTLVVSLEAIFLSIFILMAQKRESAIAELREELGLQVNLRIEEEVTKTLQLVTGLYTRLGHRPGDDPELHDMLQPLDIASIERELLEQIAAAAATRRGRRGRRSADVRIEAAPQAIIELASIAAEADREVMRDTTRVQEAEEER
ncbi:MAG: DUF1003 domain-containing protein [Gemmatimonadota bacterium]|nr:DUF1003 domain-containing protein [Gemmatimonadota bacterium]